MIEEIGSREQVRSPITPPGVRRRPTGTTNKTVNRRLDGQFVPGSAFSYKQQRLLASTVDEIEVEIGPRTYDRMETDGAILKAKKIRMTGVLADELQCSPAYAEELVGPEEYRKYQIISDFCERLLRGLDRPFRKTEEQHFGNALKYGHGVAEIEWEYRRDIIPEEVEKPKKRDTTIAAGAWRKIKYAFGLGGDITSAEKTDEPLSGLKKDAVRIMPAAIKVKPRGATSFVVDDYMTVLGLVPTKKDYSKLKWNEMLPREKFMVLTMNMKDEDPRGTSEYRPCFNWWNLRTQFPAEILRYVIEETVPKAVGTMPPAAEMVPYEIERDANNNIVWEDEENNVPRMLTPAESMANNMENFRQGSGAIIPHGATLEPYKRGLTGSNDAQLFVKLIKICNDEIENPILGQTLAQSEGEHQARSASEQVAEILYNLVFWDKWNIATMVMKDLFEPAIRMNFGDEWVKYMPSVSMGDFVRRNWNNDLEVVADAYFKGFIDDSQRASLMEWLNLPKPGPSRQEIGMEQAAKQDVNGQPVPQPTTRPDKQAGTKDRNNGNGTEKKSNGRSRKPAQNGATLGLGIGDVLGHHTRSPFRFRNNL